MVFKTSARPIQEFGNSCGTGPAIWGYLCSEVLKVDDNAWLFGDKAKQLWTLDNDETVAKCLRMTLRFTYDMVLCPLPQAKELAAFLIEAGKITKKSRPQCVNRWEEVGAALKQAKHDKRALGFGLGCTSVSDPWEWWPENNERQPWDMFSCEDILTKPTGAA